MTVEQIKEKSGLPEGVAESLYWHCLWLRDAKPDTDIMWVRLLKDKKYRCSKIAFLNKH